MIAAAMLTLAGVLVVSCGVQQPTLSPEDYGCPWPTTCVPPTIVDTGLAYGIPCKPPCWQGLTPGQSTRQEALREMARLRASGQVDAIDQDETTGDFVVYPVQGMLGAVHGYFQDGILEEVGGTIEFEYTVGELVALVGPPEGLYPKQLGAPGGCYSCDRWRPSSTPEMYGQVWFLYPSRGLVFLVFVPLSGSGCICPEMKVAHFCYYRPCSIGEATNSCGDVCLHKIEGLLERDLGTWHGYGGGY